MTEDFLKAVKDAGIVGAGGAGFPTHIKLAANVEYVIANGSECEPLLQVDQQLMCEFADEVILGLEIAIKLTKARKGIIALKTKYEKAISTLTKAIGSKNRITLHLLDDSYPSGDEHVLVHEVSKSLGKTKIVPEGGIPLQIGYVVQNVGTLINVARASSGIPVTSRWVTITGAVKKPKTIEVPIGTSIRTAIDIAGGPEVPKFKVILGGPMMGKVARLDDPIKKTDSGIIVLPSNHSLIQRKISDLQRDITLTKAACIKCELCTDICPRYLLGHALYPDKIMKSIATGVSLSSEVVTGAFLCTECGICSYYACVMDLDPCRMNKEIKQRLTAAGIKNPHKNDKLSPHEFQELRSLPRARLIGRLALDAFNKAAPLSKEQVRVKSVQISLRQHLGAPSKPIVKSHDAVNEGDLIGIIPEDAKVGANVHSSISGIVTKISSEYVTIQQTS